MAKQSSMVSIPVADARALFLAMGFQTAGDWPLERLAEKLEELESTVDEEVREELGEDELATVDKVLAGIDQGAKIVVDDGSAGVKTKTRKEKKAEAAAKAETLEAETPEAETPRKSSGARRATRGRLFYAGQVIAEYGLDVGITDEMVAEVNASFGKDNDSESKGKLASAYHAINGYLDAQDAKK